MNWPGWLKSGSLRICCLRTWWVSSIMTTAGHLRQSSTRWTTGVWCGIGNVLTAKISAFPNQETACTLSDILMSDVEEKYFLSPKTAGTALVQRHGGPQGKRVYSPEGLSCTLAANPGGFGGKTGLYEVGGADQVRHKKPATRWHRSVTAST